MAGMWANLCYGTIEMSDKISPEIWPSKTATCQLNGMGSEKASDKDILEVVRNLKLMKAEEWEARFGPDSSPFKGVRRAEIQDGLEVYKGIQYSVGGMRSRLKKMVENGLLEKFRISERIVFYL